MLLNTDDIRQDSDFDCGAACLAVLLAYYGIQRPGWVRKLCDPKDGLQPDAVKAAMRACLGSAASVVSIPMTVGVLKGFCEDGKPVLCPILVGGVGHWTVVRGVTKARVFFHDPITGRRSLPVHDWELGWADEAGGMFNRWGVTGWV